MYAISGNGQAVSGSGVIYFIEIIILQWGAQVILGRVVQFAAPSFRVYTTAELKRIE